jgi:2-keto-4-pentenoate hydratase
MPRACAVQERNRAQRVAAGARPVGYKVGMTFVAMQMVPLAGGDWFEAEIGGFGSVRVGLPRRDEGSTC